MEANKERASKDIIIRGGVYLYNILFVDDIISFSDGSRRDYMKLLK